MCPDDRNLCSDLFEESFIDPKPGPRGGNAELSNNAENSVRDHYDKRKTQTMLERSQSVFINLRKFNNWLKNTLIRRFCLYLDDYGLNDGQIGVLDLCGGKFGDLLKWRKLCTEGFVKYVAIADISSEEIKKGLTRYNDCLLNPKNQFKDGDKMFLVDFYVGDCFAGTLEKVFRDQIPFDLISCQFALHYAFESEEVASRTIKSISACLKKGGYFIGTMTDANVIVKNLRETGKTDSKGRVYFGGENHKITFYRPMADFPASQLFDLRYKFFMKDTIFNVDEFLVHPRTFMKLCHRHGLKCVLFQNFHEFYQEVMRSQIEPNRESRSLFERNVLGLRAQKRNFRKLSDETETTECDWEFPEEDWNIVGFGLFINFR